MNKWLLLTLIGIFLVVGFWLLFPPEEQQLSDAQLQERLSKIQGSSFEEEIQPQPATQETQETQPQIETPLVPPVSPQSQPSQQEQKQTQEQQASAPVSAQAETPLTKTETQEDWQTLWLHANNFDPTSFAKEKVRVSLSPLALVGPFTDQAVVLKKKGGKDDFLASWLQSELDFSQASSSQPRFQVNTPVSQPAYISATEEASKRKKTTKKKTLPKKPEYQVTKEEEREYIPMSFQVLASYDMPEVATKEDSQNIPDYIKDLDQKELAVLGYTLPIELEGRNVRTFLLVRTHQMCCYGAKPRIHEFVFVNVKEGADATYYPYIPVAVIGKFELQQEYHQEQLVGLYHMVASEIVSPRDPRFLQILRRVPKIGGSSYEK